MLGRLNDRRVQQFWDHDHILSEAVKKAETAGQHHPDCCLSRGSLWDLDAVYRPGARWGESLPEPALLNGPVVQTTNDLDEIVAKAAW